MRALLPGLILPPERPVIRTDDLDLVEARIVKGLAWGAENARRVDELAAEVGLSERRLQKVIDHLVFKHRIPVGTSMRPPFGNYLIDSTEDLALTIQLYTRRGLHSFGKASGLRRQSLQRFLEHVQTHLDLTELGEGD